MVETRSIHVEVVDSGFVLRRRDETGRLIQYQSWEANLGGQDVTAYAVIASMVQVGTALVVEDGNGAHVLADFAARLEDDVAVALDLPPPVPFMLEINALGRLGTLRLDVRWIDESGLRVRDWAQKGCFLEARGNVYRIVSPIYEALEQLQVFNNVAAPTVADQASAWADIQELVGFASGKIKPGAFLERLQIARANRFSLDFVPDADGTFQIVPVPLMDVPPPVTIQEDKGIGDSASSTRETQRILNSEQQVRFQQAFHGRSNVQGQYLGGNDVVVLLSPPVRESLAVVRQMQLKTPAERMAFARNPYPFFKAAGMDGDVPFAETRSFSDRVTGLGALEKITLPWQILGGQGWLPPKVVAVELDGRIFEFSPSAVDAGIVDVEFAIAKGIDRALVGAESLPATREVRDALLQARGDLDERANTEEVSRRSVVGGGAGKIRMGLQLTRNLEQADYQARRMERRGVDRDLPPLETTLKDHQDVAVRWLQARWASGARGALLADDMGLGKTLSALTFLIWLRRAMCTGEIEKLPVLIVAPVSLLDNWQAEHARHVGASPGAFIDIRRAYGSNLQKKRSGLEGEFGGAMLNLDDFVNDRFGQATCVLTTYETLRDYQQSFASIHFAAVVLDEAQRIKNPASLTWSAVSALHADFWIALTGTPVENRLADLWAIADAIEPGFLGSLRDFSRLYEKELDEQALRGLKSSLEHSETGSPFMMRRMKEQILTGIPKKNEHVHALPMPVSQATAYKEIVASARDKTAPKQMLEIVQQLREASLHYLRPTECSASIYTTTSARFLSLMRLLDEICAADEKVLIFLDRNLIESYLAFIVKERYGLDQLPSIINGDVPSTKRQKIVDAFQGRPGFEVMILSPKAGGVGLTLTAANHVIHLSRWWNPAVEDQSTDRVYRIGQRRPVHVHYLQAVLEDAPGESFDERLHVLLQKKRALSRELLWPFESESSDSAALLGRTI